MKVIFDSNVLIEDESILDLFPVESILFPVFMIRELDTLKKRFPKLKKIIKWIKENPETTIDIDYPGIDYVDDKIVKFIKRNKKYEDLHLITNDTVLQIRCHHLNVTVCEYKTPIEQKDRRFSYNKTFNSEQIQKLMTEKTTRLKGKFNYNSFTIDKKNGIICFNNMIEKRYELIELHSSRSGIAGPINMEQACVTKLLHDDKIPCVFIRGKAGSGKTTLAVISALNLLSPQVTKKNMYKKNDAKYKSISICRPNITLGKDIGYLPGTLEEKTLPFLAPIKDAFRVISGSHDDDMFNDLIFQKMLEIVPMAFLRGRSLNGQILIIDEAQNCNYHELKSILTRAGKDCKIIMTGDEDQHDIRSSGFTEVINKLIDEKLVGQFVLEKCERSELASLAVKKLQNKKSYK